MTDPKYIAVDGYGGIPSIIKRCDDKACNKWHEWVTLGRARYYEASQIAKAMNGTGRPDSVLSHDEIETALRRVPLRNSLDMDDYDELARSVGQAIDAKLSRASQDVRP